MALADQTHFNGDVIEAMGLHRRSTVPKGINRGRHDGMRGDDVRGKEEVFRTPCPFGSGYKRIEDPLSLVATGHFERAKRSRDRTSQPWTQGPRFENRKEFNDLTI